MKVSIERIPERQQEELLIRCHHEEAEWVVRVSAAAKPQVTVTAHLDDASYVLPVHDIYYYEVVDGKGFLYAEKKVYETRMRLYEFEELTAHEQFFRCGKSMVLNARKIDHVVPNVSGRFAAVLRNGEKVSVSRQYVAEMRRQLGI